MGLMQIPLFTWSLYATAWVQILATPVIAITFVLVVDGAFPLDRAL